jgi:hypothetical protein
MTERRLRRMLERAALYVGTILAVGTAGVAAGWTKLPDSAVVLDGKMARPLLRQCSRDAPRAGERTWQPDAAQIAQLEAALPEALKAAQARKAAYRKRANRLSFQVGLDWSKTPSGWRRQYVGLVRAGHRLIYGNYFRSDLGDEQHWRTEPVIACDGGALFFGVEYDVDARRFTHVAFNEGF